jgi:capsule polysaccharide export protein KpsE/RkpR
LKFFKVEVLHNGEIRVSADLDSTEKKYGCVVRGFNSKEARKMARELLDAADKAENRG